MAASDLDIEPKEKVRKRSFMALLDGLVLMQLRDGVETIVEIHNSFLCAS